MSNLHDAVVSNDRKTTLLALRDTIAETIDTTDSGRDIAALSKRLMEVISEIESIPDPEASKNPLQEAQNESRKRKRND